MEEIEPDKPLFHMVKKLIGDGKSRRTKNISGKEFEDILNFEFNIPIEECSVVEVTVYSKTLGAFVKFWPRWVEVDMKCSKCKPEPKYVFALCLELKSYLLQVLNKAMQELNLLVEKDDIEIEDTKTEKVVMEIICSQQRLKHLFYQKPNPQSYSIFYLGELPQVKTSAEEKSLTIEHILNWFDVKLTLTTPQLQVSRKISGNNNYKLFNKKVFHTIDPIHHLSDKVYSKPINAKEKLKVNEIVTYLLKLERFLNKQNKTETNKWIANEIRQDLTTCRNSEIYRNTEYQFYLSEYSYTRNMPRHKHIQTDSEKTVNPFLYKAIDPDNFDLELRETIKPSCTFVVEVFKRARKQKNLFDTFSMSLECLQCEKSWDSCLDAQNHFVEQHSDEMLPNWNCSKCKGESSSESLVEARWHHVCLNQETYLN